MRKSKFWTGTSIYPFHFKLTQLGWIESSRSWIILKGARINLILPLIKIIQIRGFESADLGKFEVEGVYSPRKLEPKLGEKF